MAADFSSLPSPSGEPNGYAALTNPISTTTYQCRTNIRLYLMLSSVGQALRTSAVEGAFPKAVKAYYQKP